MSRSGHRVNNDAPLTRWVECDHIPSMAETRNSYVRTRCTQAERERWSALAREQGISLSELIRGLLQSEAISVSEGRASAGDLHRQRW